ncbi:GTP-binding protein HflX [Bradyrhizobium sp. USDA 4353]
MEPRDRQGFIGLSRPDDVKTTGLVIVVGPYLRARRGDDAQSAHADMRDFEARIDEAAGLARAIDLQVVESILAPIGQIRPATYLGKGKVDEIAGVIASQAAELVVMDCALSPIQQRNLEKAWNTKVLDRTGLILEIFGRRAKTKEGALQVELAHLNYQRSRLVRSWTHLERQRGGFGFMGGPGETQIEADRRLIGDRITRLENELKKVQATRRLHRAGRQRVPYRVVALVGYTNAGKSTLFNRLTRADVQAADMLFATLDPTLRAISLPHGGKAMLSDTVGFISNLPTQLVAAFRATLEEVLEADVILHVRDMSHEDAEAQQHDVELVLSQLGIDPEATDSIIEVWNKIDRLDEAARENLANIAARAAAGAAMLFGVRRNRGRRRCAAAGDRGPARSRAHDARPHHRRVRRRRYLLAASQRRGARQGAARGPLRHDGARRCDQARHRRRALSRRAPGRLIPSRFRAE